MKVTDEKQQDPDPDPLARGTDPKIRIQIRTKMSRIRNTDMKLAGSILCVACDGGEEECGHPLEAADGPLQPLLHLLVVQRHLLQ